MALRRRGPLLVAAALAVVAGALVAGRAGDERRLGRIAGDALAARLGLTITIDRARLEPGGLALLGVRVEDRRRALSLRAGRVDVAVGGGAIAAGIRLGADAGLARVAGSASDATGLDALREHVLRLSRLPGAIRLRMPGAALQGRDGTYRLDVTGEKSASGDVTVGLTLTPPGQARALRIDAHATASSDAEVAVRVDLAGEPGRLGALWPAALPAPGPVAARSDVRLRPGGVASATGRLTMGAAAPAVIDFTARYDAATAAVDVTRWSVVHGDAVRLAGAARADAPGGALRLTATAGGVVDGARVDGDARYEANGAFAGEVTAGGVSLAALAHRLGSGTPPLDAQAREVRVRIAGRDDGRTIAATVDATAAGVEARALGVVRALDGALEGAVHLTRADGGIVAGRVERGRLALTTDGAPVATVGARSLGAALWPVGVEARVPDGGALARLLPQVVGLEGTGGVVGELDGADGVLRFHGVADAQVARAELSLGTPVALSALRATAVPVRWNAGGVERPGALSVGRVRGLGLLVENVASSATLIDGLLRLPDLRYRHYDGPGSGWAEVGIAGPAPPLRARVEGRRVDLAEVVRETAPAVARVTGRVRYTGSVQRLAGRGVDALVQLVSEEGGEIGIDAIERLLDSAAVEADSTGLVRQTLENLRVFEYESLDGALRAVDGKGTIDLSIRGRRPLGLFPAPVQAINFRNVPLQVLASALEGGISR